MLRRQTPQTRPKNCRISNYSDCVVSLRGKKVQDNYSGCVVSLCSPTFLIRTFAFRPLVQVTPSLSTATALYTKPSSPSNTRLVSATTPPEVRSFRVKLTDATTNSEDGEVESKRSTVRFADESRPLTPEKKATRARLVTP